jgi:large subunit ribosomal protein L31
VKTDIHPEYHATTVTCSCGNSFETRSTASSEELHVELCNECHPFFTGKQKLVDSGGRVERFRKRYGKSTFTAEEAPVPAAAAEKAATPVPDTEPGAPEEPQDAAAADVAQPAEDSAVDADA